MIVSCVNAYINIKQDENCQNMSGYLNTIKTQHTYTTQILRIYPEPIFVFIHVYDNQMRQTSNACKRTKLI